MAVCLGERCIVPDTFDPDLDLVVILETSDRILLAFTKGLLEEAGIPFYILGQITTLIQDVDPFLHKRVRVQVPSDREVEARELLEGLLQAQTTGAGELDAEEPGPNISTAAPLRLAARAAGSLYIKSPTT